MCLINVFLICIQQKMLRSEVYHGPSRWMKKLLTRICLLRWTMTILPVSRPPNKNCFIFQKDSLCMPWFLIYSCGVRFVTAANQNSSMQFQYPPFNAKEAPPSSWNNKPRRSTAPSSASNYGKIFYIHFLLLPDNLNILF